MEVVPGVNVIDTAGPTPGHVSIELAGSGGDHDTSHRSGRCMTLS